MTDRMDFGFDIESAPWLPVALTVIAVVLFIALSNRKPPPPVPQDAMDGLYTNHICPSFQITDATLQFEGHRIIGEVKRGKSSLYWSSDSALRYELSEDACILIAVDQGVNMSLRRISLTGDAASVKIFSVDRERAMDWVRSN